jgi:hypothetical protein
MKLIAASTIVIVSDNHELLLIRHPIRGWEMDALRQGKHFNKLQYER